jgi:hypothetical protein
LVALIVAGLGVGGWTLVALFGTWALLDGACLLAGTCRRYDEGARWVRSLVEGWTQLSVGVFVWIWWGAGPAAISVAAAIAVSVAAAAVLGRDIVAAWRGAAVARVAPGAIAAIFLVLATLATGTSERQAAAALSTYAIVFIIATAARGIAADGRQAVRSTVDWSSMQ